MLLSKAQSNKRLWGYNIRVLRQNTAQQTPRHPCRWPRLPSAQGRDLVLEAGEALLLPQGTWHHVQSLDVENVSLSLLFAADRIDGGLECRAGRVPLPRRPAALAELAKAAEAYVGCVWGVAPL